jgi:hypothetical protein
MLRLLSLGTLLLGVAGCGGGEVVAVRFAGKDANPSGYYTCKPDAGTTFVCASAQVFDQAARELGVGQACPYGIASLYVETSATGKVTRIQYDCAAAPL